MERILKLALPPGQPPASVGQILRREAGLTSRQISRAKFRPGGIAKNGIQCRVTDLVFPGDILTVCLEDASSGSDHLEPPPRNLPPLHILYEDPDFLAVNKPAGIVTHPSGKHYSDSLSNQVFWYFRDRGQHVTIRSVGRLDKETSGIVIFAKNRTAASRLQAQQGTGVYKKEYLAVVSGFLPAGSCRTIDLPLAPDPLDLRKITAAPSGSLLALPPYKPAVTHFRVLYSTPLWSLVTLRLDTGRTHQIRVHMKATGHPLLGDTLYADSLPGSPPLGFTRAALHAWRVTLVHPFQNTELCIEAELPEDFLPLKEYTEK